MPGLKVRLLADRSGGEKGGVRVEGEVPAECRLPTSWVARGIAEGWMTGEGHETAVRPSGPAGNPWRPDKQPHVFHHYDALVLHTVDGDVRFAVTHQPDKYADPGNDSTPVTDEVYAAGKTRVDWWYGVELEG